jgi:gamma-glutamyltranspeptidase
MVAEAMRGAVADRMRYLGDPDHEKVDLARLTSAKRLAVRKKSIALDRTHALPRFGLEEHGTHHLVTADASGNVVSLTTTVNRVFGAKLMAPKSGVVLNDELDDFTAKADVASFGLQESPNRARAGARPVSSMTPTLVVKDGRVVLALGGSGGTTIATNVTQLVLSRLVFDKEPQAAVTAPRFQIPTSGAFLLLEPGSDRKLVEDLEWRGEIVGTARFLSSAVQMVTFDGARVLAASDPRKHGSASVR